MIDKNNFIIKETKKFMIFDYQNNNLVNNLLNDWYEAGKLIIIDKKDNNIVIKLEKDNYIINDKEVSLNSDLNEIIDLFEISNNMRMNISQKIIKLYTDSYKNIFDNFFVKENNYYIFNLKRKEELYREISKYNKYYNLINYKNVDETFDNFSLSDIDRCINSDVINIVIVRDNKLIKLYVDSDKFYLFIFRDKTMFDNVYLPEIIKLYIDKYNNVEKIEIDNQFNTSFGNINDNFYFVNFKTIDIEGYFKFVRNIRDKIDYELDLNSNYVFIKKNDEQRVNYSYGYVSILFISFIISIITIIIVLMYS